MYIYHYSKEKYPELRTLEAQGTHARPQKAPETYGKHISFFLDPIPKDIIGLLYGAFHAVWFPGNKLWEYKVDVSALGDFTYEIVESPEKTKLYYDDSLSIPEYHKKLAEVIKKCNYSGSGKKELERAATPLLHKTREYFIKASKYRNFDEIKKKYAATVPHVMAYPSTGIVRYVSATPIIIGGAKPIIEEYATTPIFMDW